MNQYLFIQGRIEFTDHALRTYRKIQCQAFPIIRPEGEEFYVTLGDGFSFDENQTPLIANDFFQIDCQSETGENYSNFHLGIRINDQLKQRSSLFEENPSHYNILMFGFDSVSRLTFMRLLPKTHSYLINQLGSIVMEGDHLSFVQEKEISRSFSSRIQHRWRWNDAESVGFINRTSNRRIARRSTRQRSVDRSNDSLVSSINRSIQM